MWTAEKQNRAEVGGALVSLRGNLEAMLETARRLSAQISPQDRMISGQNLTPQDIGRLGEDLRKVSRSLDAVEEKVPATASS